MPLALRFVRLVPVALALVVLGLAAPSAALAQSFSVNSPDGQVTATIKVVGGNLFYNLTRSGQSVIDDSRLGLILNNGGSEDLGAGIASLNSLGVNTVNTTYATLGLHPTAVNNYNTATYTISKAGGNNDSAVEFRVYNDGLAFRYVLPTETSSGPRTVLGEATQWKLPAAATSGWYQQGSNADYANLWANAPVSATSGTDMEGDDRLMGPVVVNYNNGYAAIGESDYWGYSGMTYVGSGNNTRTIQAAFIRDTSGWQVPSGSNSPWRTIVTTPNLNGLVNSDMTNNVARPANAALYPDGVNTSWILPGRSLWSWLDTNNVASDGVTPANGAGVNETNMKQYVDEAQKLGFEYVTIDSGWKNWGGGGNGAFTALAGVVTYAHARGIKIIAWKDSHDFYSGDLVTGDFSIPAMTTFLDQLDATGADGVKMDFLRQTGHLVGEYQRLLNFMSTTYETAAARQLVVDFHGAPKTAGQTISYPNSLTTEDLAGLEGGAKAGHDATLPFTTLLSGPADYTPGVFSSADNPNTTYDENGKRDATTWSHSLAMGVLITSPIIHWAAGPKSIDNAFPDGSPQLEVFKNIPATWDETKVLDVSQIGVLAAFARREGDTWFLAMVNGDPNNPKTVNDISLSFLSSGVYQATLVQDNLAIDEAFNTLKVPALTLSYDLDVTMRRGGGFVAMFTPVLLWTGATSGTWDINTTQNWNHLVTPSIYVDGQPVVLGNGVANRNITISGTVLPASVTVNNDTNNDYAIGGGAIDGATGLLKQGAGTLTLTSNNTFTGATVIQGGVIAVTTLSNGGTFSGIGSSTNAASNLTLDGGTLRWTGSTTTSTDRLFTLGTGGGTLDAAPTTSVALTFSNTGALAFTGSGPRTLTLTGAELNMASIKANMLAAVIGDAAVGQPTSLVKNGNNYWVLSGNNTYSGGTTINAGRLRPTTVNSLGTGPVTVADGGQAYLSLSGTIANAFTIAGNGITETIGGNPYNLGALRVQSGPNLTGQITLAGNARITARGSNGILAGRITGPFALELGGSDVSSTQDGLTLSSLNNDWTGGLTISLGKVTSGAANVIPNGLNKGNVTINGPAAGTAVWNLNGFSETINGLLSTGTGVNAQITNEAGTPVTLTVGDNDQSSTFGGVLKNTGGALSLTKIGVGTQTLTGANTYTGVTTINNGTLQLGATQALKKLKLDGAAATLNLNTATSNAKSFEVTAAGGSLNHQANAFSVLGGSGETVTWNSGAALDVNGTSGGKLLFNLAAATGVAVTDNTAQIVVHPGATLELAGSTSATNSGGNFVNLQNDSTTSLKVSGTNQQVGNLDGLGNTTVATNANLVAGRVVQNSLDLQNGAALTVRRSGGNPQGLNSQVSVLNSLSLANDGAAIDPPPEGGYTTGERQYLGKLDLMNNDLIIKNGSPALFAEIQDMVRAGLLTGGASGITSQEALSSGDYAGVTWLGSIYNAFDDDQDPQTPDVPLLTSFDGVSLVGGEIIVKYTWFGDADLSGLVDGFDDSLLSAGYFGGDPVNRTLNPWLSGDFDYNGVIDGFDASLLSAGYFSGGATVELPEPSALLLAAFGAAVLLASQAHRPTRSGRKPLAA